MTGHPLERILAGWRYKAGWKFSLIQVTAPSAPYMGDSRYELHIEARVLDSMSERGATIMVYLNEIVPPAAMDWGEHRWLIWLASVTRKFETHEMCEAIDYRGRKIFFPHGENGQGVEGIHLNPDPPLSPRYHGGEVPGVLGTFGGLRTGTTNFSPGD